jgi:hypothetical protein
MLIIRYACMYVYARGINIISCTHACMYTPNSTYSPSTVIHTIRNTFACMHPNTYIHTYIRRINIHNNLQQLATPRLRLGERSGNPVHITRDSFPVSNGPRSNGAVSNLDFISKNAMEAKGHTPVAMEKDREAKRGRFEVCCMLSVCVYVCIVCVCVYV